MSLQCRIGFSHPKHPYENIHLQDRFYHAPHTPHLYAGNLSDTNKSDTNAQKIPLPIDAAMTFKIPNDLSINELIECIDLLFVEIQNCSPDIRLYTLENFAKAIGFKDKEVQLVNAYDNHEFHDLICKVSDFVSQFIFFDIKWSWIKILQAMTVFKMIYPGKGEYKLPFDPSHAYLRTLNWRPEIRIELLDNPKQRDLSEIRQIMQSSFCDKDVEEVFPCWDLKLLQRTDEQGFFVARLTNHSPHEPVIGLIRYQIISGPRNYKDLHLHVVARALNVGCAGVGTRMFSYFFGEKSNGNWHRAINHCQRAQLWVRTMNFKASNLYFCFGFNIVQSLPNVYEYPKSGSFIMVKNK